MFGSFFLFNFVFFLFLKYQGSNHELSIFLFVVAQSTIISPLLRTGTRLVMVVVVAEGKKDKVSIDL